MVNRYIKRILEGSIRQLSKKFPVITLLGPRQSGKTTLLKKMYPHYRYFSLESPDIRLSIQNDPRGFLDQHMNESIIIDEFQRFPELPSYLQEYADDRYVPGQVFLTGSQQYQINEKISQSLSGRTGILKLLPLTLEEITRVYPLSGLETMMITGSYPAIFDREMEPHEWYPSYVETYVERDVRQLLNVGNLDKFMLFIHVLAARAGQLLNMNNVGIEVGISQPTARQWLSILNQSQLTFMLQPIHRNINKRLLKTPKLYFTDTGLLCYLLGIRTESDLRSHPLVSAIFENYVISEFYKYRFSRIAPQNNLMFYRDKNGKEVDLIVEDVSKLQLFEIKYTGTVRSDHFRHLNILKGILSADTSRVIYAGSQKLHGVIGWKELADLGKLLK